MSISYKREKAENTIYLVNKLMVLLYKESKVVNYYNSLSSQEQEKLKSTKANRDKVSDIIDEPNGEKYKKQILEYVNDFFNQCNHI